MRGLFRRGGHSSGCCDSGCGTGCGDGCNSCGGGGAPAGFGPGGAMMAAPKGGELIPAPKDGTPPKAMPDGKNGKDGKDGKDDTSANPGVQINVVPNAPIPAAAPALESAPPVAPAQRAPQADKTEPRPF